MVGTAGTHLYLMSGASASLATDMEVLLSPTFEAASTTTRFRGPRGFFLVILIMHIFKRRHRLYLSRCGSVHTWGLRTMRQVGHGVTVTWVWVVLVRIRLAEASLAIGGRWNLGRFDILVCCSFSDNLCKKLILFRHIRIVRLKRSPLPVPTEATTHVRMHTASLCWWPRRHNSCIIYMVAHFGLIRLILLWVRPRPL